MNDTFKILPILPLRGLVLYPKMILHFDVSRDMSKAALNRAMKNGREIFVVCQKDMKINRPTVDDLYKIGVIARVKQVMKLPNSSTKQLIIPNQPHSTSNTQQHLQSKKLMI